MKVMADVFFIVVDVFDGILFIVIAVQLVKFMDCRGLDHDVLVHFGQLDVLRAVPNPYCKAGQGRESISACDRTTRQCLASRNHQKYS
jgi:hypothetical protein